MARSHLNNPAGRLFEALSYLRSHHNSSNHNPVLLRTVLCGYFEIDEADDPSYFAKVSGLMALPVQIREEVGDLDDPFLPPEQLLRPLPVVERFLGDHAAGRDYAHTALAVITDGTMNDLEACSHILSRMREFIDINAEELDDIRSAAQALVDAILADGGLPVGVRQTLLRLAHNLLRAVDEYKVGGGDAVLDAWDTMAGMAARNTNTVSLAKRVVGAIRDLGMIIATVVTVANAPEQVGNGIEFVQGLFAVEGPGEVIAEELA